MGEAPMDEKLVAACQMFLVPATILFAALAVATREALKTLLCIIGVVVSTAWLYRLYRWTGLTGRFRVAGASSGAAMSARLVSFDQKRTGLTPGTVLVREWDRRSQRVMVMSDGFAWN